MPEPKPPLPRVRVSRLGLVLFAAYVALYAGFMGLVLGWPEALFWRPVAGVNLAVLAGLGLIVGAVLLSLIFMLAGSGENHDAA